MDDELLQQMDKARQHIAEAVASTPATNAEHERAIELAQQVFGSVLPRLPAMIEARIEGGTARIYSAQQLTELLTYFALDILSVQVTGLRRTVAPTGDDHVG